MSTTDAHDALAGNPKLFLDEVGYLIESDSEQSDAFIWTSPSDESENVFGTPAEALEAAWADAAQQAQSVLGISEPEWIAMPFEEQKLSIFNALGPH